MVARYEFYNPKSQNVFDAASILFKENLNHFSDSHPKIGLN